MYEQPAYVSTSEIPFSQPEIPFSQPAIPGPLDGNAIDVIGTGTDGMSVEPQPETPCPEVNVFIKEIVPTTPYGSKSDYLEFDVIMNTSCENQSATLIKKIKFCKRSLMQDIMNQQTCNPATIVEQVQENRNSIDATSKRIRELCGIPNAKNWV